VVGTLIAPQEALVSECQPRNDRKQTGSRHARVATMAIMCLCKRVCLLLVCGSHCVLCSTHGKNEQSSQPSKHRDRRQQRAHHTTPRCRKLPHD